MPTKTPSCLDQLHEHTVVVVDSGDFETITSTESNATDATTNPSLMLKAAQMEQYAHLLHEAVEFGKAKAEK